MKKLDEMKRLKLLKIEEKGFYLMFYGLVFVIVVQAFLNDFKDTSSNSSIVLFGSAPSSTRST